MVQRITSYDDAAAAALGRIVTACHEGDGREPLDEAARLHLRHHGLHDAQLWLSDDGFALLRRHGTQHSAGHSAAHVADHDAGHDLHDGVRVELDLAVAPAARRHGQGGALLAEALATAGPVPVTAWSHGDHPGAAALAAEAGFERVRELLVLARPLPLDTDAPVAGAMTDRATSEDRSGDIPRIRSWRDDDADELLRVNAAAFAHHPEQGAMDRANLAERMAEPWFDPAGLLIATGADDRLLGFHWTKVHANAHGEVYVVAVDPTQHGRGLGRTLLEAGLRHLADRGCDSVHLYVEADNAPALALYRGLGFTTDHAHVQYARP